MRLSIITSCYSNTPYFVEMLESFLRSGYHFRDTEIIICDDCSPAGGEGDTARKYAEKYPDLIKVVRNDTRQHVRRSFNRVSLMAQGQYILPFDSDDVFVPFDLDGAMDFLDEHQEYCGSYGKKRLFDSQTGDIGQNHGGDHSVFAITIDPRITHNAMLIRTSDMRQSGGYLPDIFPQDVTQLPDVFLWVGMGMHKSFYFDNSLRAFYRQHITQYSKADEKYCQGYNILRSSLISRYPELYNAIANHQPVQICPEDRLAAVALLGAAWMEEVSNGGNTAKLLGYCDAAQMLLPDDYGIREYRMKVLMAQQRYGEVLSQAMLMAVEHPGKLYIQQLAMGWANDAAEKLNLPSEEFKQKRAALLGELFAMTPEQQQLFRRTIDNFLKK